MKHLTDEQLSARLDRALSGRALEEAERHLAGCAQCRDALSVLGAHDRFLGAALVHDPGEEYFATFAARVEDRLRAEGLRGAQARLSHDQAPWIRWFNAPRRVAWTAAVATIVAGAAIVILTTREDRMPALEGDRTLTRITAQSAPSPSATSAPVAPAPSESYGAKEANPANQRPVGARAKNPGAPEQAKARAQERDDAMALAPGPEHLEEGTGASPSRMRPVPGATSAPPEPRLTSQMAAEPPAAPAPEGRGVHVVKRNYAQPLQDKDVAANQAKQAEGMREEKATQKLQAGAGTPSSGAQAGPGFASIPPSAGALVAPATRPGEVQLCGRIVDGQGRAVAHASVALVTIGRTATSSESGDFCMSAPDGSYELSVMAVGFQTSRMQVRVAGERSDVRVTLDAISVLDGLAKTEQTRRLQESQAAPMSATTGGATADAQKPAPAPADAKKAMTSTTSAKAKEPPKDPFAGEKKEGAQAAATAMAATRYAATYPTLPTWLKAAGLWGDAAEAVKTPIGRGEALYRIAEARVNVWRQYPTPTRKNDALATCNTVMSGTPTPEQRKDAIRWMNEVRRGPTGRD